MAATATAAVDTLGSVDRDARDHPRRDVHVGLQETREKLRDLYDKANRGQWISDDVLPWNTDVDLEQADGRPSS